MLRPDAQAFDEVKIFTVPRYKMSGLSGDEWRISATLQFMRKGVVIHEESYRNVQAALVFAAGDALRACDDGKGWFASVDDLCDQEGCAVPATVRYKKKQNICREGHAVYMSPEGDFRQFCDTHKERGDCGLDDADLNYVPTNVTPIRKDSA